jgi:hypothetical protein
MRTNLCITGGRCCLLVWALLFHGCVAFGAATRHQCSAADANIAAFQNLAVTVPNNCTASGSSATYTNSYVVGGCRGCGFLIEWVYDATVSGMTIDGDRAYTRAHLQDGVFTGAKLTNNVVNTNFPCNVFASAYGHSIHTTHGQDRIDLIYETDGAWNQGLYAEIFDAEILAVWDDHGDIVFDVETLPADGKSKAHPRVTNPLAYPSEVLEWSLRGSTEEETLGCTINAVTGEITAGKVSGKVVVRASATDIPGCFIEKELQVGCDPCRDCDAPGNGKLAVESVKITIGAGKAEFGSSAGVFQIRADTPSAALSTPQLLKYYIGGVDTNQVKVLSTNGHVRQVFAPQSLANVVSNSATEYKIEFYAPGTYGTQPTNGGLYGITGSPTTVWTIKNPDSPSLDRLLVPQEATPMPTSTIGMRR